MINKVQIKVIFMLANIYRSNKCPLYSKKEGETSSETEVLVPGVLTFYLISVVRQSISNSSSFTLLNISCYHQDCSSLCP